MIDTTKLRELAQTTIQRGEAGFERDDPYDTYPEDLFASLTIPENIIELLDRLEVAERDAKRYLHLRDDGGGFDIAVRNGGDEGEYWVHGYPPEELDAAIDAAMQQEQNQ